MTARKNKLNLLRPMTLSVIPRFTEAVDGQTLVAIDTALLPGTRRSLCTGEETEPQASYPMASGGTTKVEICEPTEQPSASPEALEFMSSVGLDELRLCQFPESLQSLSDSFVELGSFTASVQSTYYEQDGPEDQQCLLVHISSQSTVDDVPCGSAITAYISIQLETLEQHHHEFVKVTQLLHLHYYVTIL
uniref:Ciliogenesis-associated TTC17-interacting protein n=1 Tax=Engystomops pustulosus TaxID=76066 RepID=A0AAV6Z3H2_ENGPU|nr:hypothetical protein GDO81_030000 [Engystomops pustulosus]